MKEILFKYVIDCKVKNKTERVFILVDIEDLENSNDFNELLFNRADEAFKELIGHECHCINESQSFCDCGEFIDDFEIVERLQYIGIKDKNDTKMFSGDKFRVHSKNNENWHIDKIVRINPNSLTLEVTNLDELKNEDMGQIWQRPQEYWWEDRAGRIEIIGKIYE